MPPSSSAAQARDSLATGSTVSGAGTVLFSNGAYSVDAAYNVGQTSVTSGTITFSHADSTGTLNLSNGTFITQANFTVQNAIIWAGGTMRATITLAATGTLSLDGADDRSFMGTFNNAGTVAWTGTGSLFLNSGAVWNNLATGVFDGRQRRQRRFADRGRHVQQRRRLPQGGRHGPYARSRAP